MDLETFNWLLSSAGQALLAEAMAGDHAEGARLQELTRLRRLATPARAAAAYEIAQLRRRAAAKFARAGSMYFTREALEQASGEAISTYRVQRFQPYGQIADLACGTGGDTIALAQAARVSAVDRDPLRLAMAAANARAYDVAERVTFVQADLEQAPPPASEAIFFDPARRADGRRVFALAAYQPPVALVAAWREHTPAISVKVAPGVGDDELAALGDHEVEFISLGGELKEAVLWFGPLGQPGRRATLLTRQGSGVRGQGSGAENQEPGATSQEPEKIGRPSPLACPEPSRRVTCHSLLVTRGTPLPTPPLSEPARYLYEPDPAVIRAHLVAPLAEQIGAAQLDPTIAYLTADRPLATPFARCWRIVEWLPFSVKRMRARLRALDAGAVTVKKRGSPLDADALARQLSGDGARPLVVVLTRVRGTPAALICTGPINPSTDRDANDTA